MRFWTAREELFLGTVRVIAGDSVATASLFSFGSPSAKQDHFVVTNAHVVNGPADVELFFLQADEKCRPVLGQPYSCSSNKLGLRWYKHPDPSIDIAVADFSAIETDIDSKGIALANCWLQPHHAYDDQPFVIPEEPHSLVDLFGVEVDAVEEVLFVGYPSGYYDHHNHLPIVRRGTTATSPFADYNGEPAFLIDAPVLPGSSGSPVFIVDHSVMERRRHKRFLFLGVVTEFLPFKEVGKPPRRVASEEDRLRLLTGLGLVYKPQAIRETIQSYLSCSRAI